MADWKDDKKKKEAFDSLYSAWSANKKNKNLAGKLRTFVSSIITATGEQEDLRSVLNELDGKKPAPTPAATTETTTAAPRTETPRPRPATSNTTGMAAASTTDDDWRADQDKEKQEEKAADLSKYHGQLYDSIAKNVRGLSGDFKSHDVYRAAYTSKDPKAIAAVDKLAGEIGALAGPIAKGNAIKAMLKSLDVNSLKAMYPSVWSSLAEKLGI